MQIVLMVGQVVVSLALIFLIVIQGKGGGLGTAFGANQTLYSQRRGVEKIVFYLTIVCVGLFLIFSVANLLV